MQIFLWCKESGRVCIILTLIYLLRGRRTYGFKYDRFQAERQMRTQRRRAKRVDRPQRVVHKFPGSV